MTFGIIHDEIWRDRIYRWILQVFLVAYVLLMQKTTNVVIVCLAAWWLTEPHLLEKLKAVLRNKVFLAIIALYAMHVVGLLYSVHWPDGIRKLDTRSGLLIFPILLAPIGVTRSTFVLLLKTFVWACFGVGLMGLVNSIWLYHQTGESVYLYNDNLLLLTGGQAVYFSLYLVVAMLFIGWLLVKGVSSSLERRLYLYLLVPFFSLLIFLLASRVSIVLLFVLVLGCVGVLIVKHRQYRLGTAVVTALVLGGFVMAHYFPKTINRFRSLTAFHFDYTDDTEVYHFNEKDYENRWNGFTVRLAIWSCTWEVIEGHLLFGTGTGDYMPDLRDKYREKHFKLALRHDYSPHNQYLETWLALGVVGLAVFLVSLVYPAWRAWRDGNWLFVAFILIVSLNMLTEEVMGVYRGVLFFGFFNALLLFHLPGRPSFVSERKWNAHT